MRISVLGAGAWGTAIALAVVGKGHETTLWTWESHHAEALRMDQENRAFLQGVSLPKELSFSSDLQQACSGAEALVVVVPSHAVRKTLQAAAAHISPDALIVCASKGIEAGSLKLMSEVVDDELGGGDERLVVLSGPSFAKEVARKVPTNVVAASRSAEAALRVQQEFARDWFRVYTSGDPVGVEIGGALKNVIAIAAGAGDGLGLGDNTRAALITRGIAEMARLAIAKGGEMITMAGLAGIGDLVLTCTGDLSRNRTLGKKLGEGLGVEEALRTSDGVAEGFITARSAHLLAEQLDVDMPICSAVHSVLHGDSSVADALQALLGRPMRGEWG